MKVTIVEILGHGDRDEHQLIMDKIYAFCRLYKKINEASPNNWSGNAFDKVVQSIFEQVQNGLNSTENQKKQEELMEMVMTGQFKGTISDIISHDKNISFLRLFIDSDDIQQIITAEFLFKVAEMKK